MKKGNIKKLIRNFIVFVGLIFLTLWVILKDQSITEILDVLDNVKIQFVIIGIICMAVYLILEGVNMRRTLKALGEKEYSIHVWVTREEEIEKSNLHYHGTIEIIEEDNSVAMR